MKRLRSLYGKLLWKTEESKRLTSIVFWLLTLSGIYTPFVTKEFADIGIKLSGWIIIPLLMITGFIAIVLFGHIIDKTKLWHADWVARLKRNPYEISLFRPKERKLYRNQLKLWKGLGTLVKDKEYHKALEELEEWIEKDKVK